MEEGGRRREGESEITVDRVYSTMYRVERGETRAIAFFPRICQKFISSYGEEKVYDVVEENSLRKQRGIKCLSDALCASNFFLTALISFCFLNRFDFSHYECDIIQTIGSRKMIVRQFRLRATDYLNRIRESVIE